MRLPFRSPAIATLKLRKVFFLVFRVNRSQRVLGRVLVTAVTSVYHGNRGIVRCETGGTVFGVAYHDDVGIIGDDPDGIRQALTLGGRACIRIGAGNVLSAQTKHCAFKRQAGSCAGFIKEGGENGFGS